MAKNIFSFILEVVKISLIALAIVIPIRYFLFQPFFVRGESMDPNFANGDYLIVDEITYHFRNPERGEVIIFDASYDPTQRLIKRVIGLPGEIVEVKNGGVVIYDGAGSRILDESKYLFGVETGGDLKIALKQDEFFVLGDNRPFSYDSRRFGPVKKEDIIGKVLLRAWPFASVNKFEVPIY